MTPPQAREQDARFVAGDRRLHPANAGYLRLKRARRVRPTRQACPAWNGEARHGIRCGTDRIDDVLTRYAG